MRFNSCDPSRLFAMNFFQSVFSDDPDPPGTDSDSDSPKNSEEHEFGDQSNPQDDDGWSFGGLIKTLATTSESVIETYRRDLQEFGTGLKKELEVAQGSLGSVGNAIDEFGNTVLKGTAEIISQGKEAILAAGNETDSSSDNNSSNSVGRRDSFSSKPYSRFDAQVRAVQCDLNTYCEEPEDSDDYKKWESEFSLDEKAEEVEKLLEENGDMKGLYKRAVPSMVDHDTFWFRYFYKVYKLKQAEDLRANFVKRSISQEDEEELSWDIDDEDDMGSSGDLIGIVKDTVTSPDSVEKKDNQEVPETKSVVDAAPPASDEAAPSQDSAKPDGAASLSTQQPSEEDLGWDEIEDMSSIDGKETSPNRAELRKRMSTGEEDEDLSWDIEDEDDESSASKA